MKKVLVIDDDPIIREMLRSFLVDSGYSVTLAEDGAKGLESYWSRPADVVVVDIFMPCKDGIETIGELREAREKCKILAISGGGKMKCLDFLPHAKKFGADATLVKPFGKEELLAALEDLKT